MIQVSDLHCVSQSGLKAQKYLAQGKRSGALGLACERCARPVRAKVYACSILLPLQGVATFAFTTQGAASLALG